MYGCIADDGKLAGARRDKNQNAVAMVGLGHAQPVKLFLRHGDGVIHVFSADEDADFTGSLLLGGLDGGDNLIVPQLFEKFAMLHITSFLPHRHRRCCHRRRRIRRPHPKKIRRLTSHQNYHRC